MTKTTYIIKRTKGEGPLFRWCVFENEINLGGFQYLDDAKEWCEGNFTVIK